MSNSVTAWTAAHQAPLSMGFSRQEHWSELPFPSPGDLSNPEIKLMPAALASGFLTTEPPGEPLLYFTPTHMSKILKEYKTRYIF